MRVCLESNVSEILDAAGPKGMHINDIAAKAGIAQAEKLGGVNKISGSYLLLISIRLRSDNAIVG